MSKKDSLSQFSSIKNDLPLIIKKKAWAPFQKPENSSGKIWRFMNFTKFLSLIDTRSLWFARADQFDDPWEGAFPKNYAAGALDFEKRMKGHDKDYYIHLQKFLKQNIFVNCWHANDYESEAMWRLYTTVPESIAIQSTFDDLQSCFNDDKSKYVKVGKVTYADYDLGFDYGNNDYVIKPFLHKRKSFEHEQEVRAINDDFGKYGFDPGNISGKFNGKETGRLISVDLHTLIKGIFVSPTAGSWFMQLVESICKKYGLYNMSITKSPLLEKSPFDSS